MKPRLFTTAFWSNAWARLKPRLDAFGKQVDLLIAAAMVLTWRLIMWIGRVFRWLYRHPAWLIPAITVAIGVGLYLGFNWIWDQLDGVADSMTPSFDRYKIHWPIVWWVIGIVVGAILLFLFVRWLLNRRSKTTPVPTGPYTPTPPGPKGLPKVTPSRSYPRRSGPPGLFIIIIVLVDTFVMVQQITSPTWLWPFFSWPATAAWLRSWQLWFVTILTLLTFFADWGPSDRPNAVRRTAANTVSAVFVLGIVILVLAALTAAASLVQWVSAKPM